MSYNPWSIINYLKTGRLSTYWANTSSNGLVDKLIREGSRRIVFVQQDDHLFPIVTTQELGQRPQRGNGGIIIHIGRDVFYEILFLFIQAVFLQQKVISVIQFLNQIEQALFCLIKGGRLYPGKAKEDDRVGSLKVSVFLVLPYGQPIKNLSPACVLHGKKSLQHVHVQGLPESAGTGNQGYIVSIFPPLSDKTCFINIRYYGKKVIILLDEYDTPLQEAWVYGYWKEMVELIRGLFNSTFKTNPYLERAVMTGITRVSKESIFSDLNNLEVVTTTSEKYEDSFGFTEEEVWAALQECGLYENRLAVKDWYVSYSSSRMMTFFP